MWQTLKKPFFVLAPMEDVTDAAFRALIARHGKPDVFFTEFTSADGLLYADDAGQRKLRKKLLYSDSEHPIIAQLFTSDPARMEHAAHIVRDMGFDGIDINMGCPDRAIGKSRSGAALIKDTARARSLISAAKKSGLPVSVKTRVGYARDELDTWLSELLAEEPAAITIHARTRNELSDVPARWEFVAKAVAIRNAIQNPRGDTSRMTKILGNGDVRDISDARAKADATGCDGVMLGRAIYGNPWLFADRVHPPAPQERVSALIEHLMLFDQLLSETTSYAVMKKHFKAYISGWDGARELRVGLMNTDTSAEARRVLVSAILPA